MELFRAINYKPKNMLILTEPFSLFLCSFCEHHNWCEVKTGIDLQYKHNIDKNYKEYMFDKIEKHNIETVLFAISEPTLVENRKELYALSKELFNYKRNLTQILFCNTNFFDILNLKSAYKYLTYVDYIMQNEHPNRTDFNDDGDFSKLLDCIFNGAVYIDLTKSFTSGTLITKDF